MPLPDWTINWEDYQRRAWTANGLVVVNADGSPIGGGGSGGTQYTDGTVQPTPIGNAFLAKDSGGAVRSVRSDTDGTLYTSQGLLTDNNDRISIASVADEQDGFTASSATSLIPATDISKYSTVSMQIFGTFVAFVTVQFSNDGTNYKNYGAYGSADILVFPRIAKYVRAIVTSYTSGTVQATLRLYSLPIQQSTQIVGYASPPHATLIGMNNNLNNLSSLKSLAAVGDGGSGNDVLAVGLEVFNGAANDRVRSATSADATTGLGVLGAGVLGFDGTNYRRIRTTTTGVTLTPNSSSATATESFVDVTTGTTTLLSANANRKSVILSNIGANNVYLRLAGGTATTDGKLLAPGGMFVWDTYVSVGAITAIAVTATTRISITELTQ